MTRSEIEDGAAWARRTLRKPEPITAERKPNQTERIAAWMAENRKAEGGSTPSDPVGRRADPARSHLSRFVLHGRRRAICG